MGGENLSQNLLRKTIVLSYCSSNDAVEAAVGTCGPHHLDFTDSVSVKKFRVQSLSYSCSNPLYYIPIPKEVCLQLCLTEGLMCI